MAGQPPPQLKSDSVGNTTIILFSNNSFKIRHLLTLLHTPLLRLDVKADSTSNLG